VIELLFARGEEELRAAVNTFEGAILKFWHDTILRGRRRGACHSPLLVKLLDLPATFLPVPFARQRLLDTQFLARLQIERVPLDLFNDVFLLHFTLEASEGVFQGFTVLESYFSQTYDTSKPTKDCP
jgi:hypothetical protein